MCKECGKLFKIAQNLKIHSFVHTGITFFEFKVGDSLLKTYLKLSSRIQSETKPFEFVDCEATSNK
jgi:hypothetical protein